MRFDVLQDVTDLPPLETWRARDGASLGYRTYAAPTSGTVLVLLHGSAWHGAYFAPLARELARSDAATVITPDLRGHGPAPQRRGDCDYIGQLEDDLEDLLRHLRKTRAPARLVLGGHSSGGALALRYLDGTTTREPVDAHLLLAPYLGPDAPATRRGSGGWAYPLLPVLIPVAILTGMGVKCVARAKVIYFRMPRDVRDGTETLWYSFRLLQSMNPRAIDAKHLAPLAEKPTLVLVGADDEAFYAEKFASAFQPARAMVELIPHATHLGVVHDPRTAERCRAWLMR